MGKSRLAPIKTATTPRLELNAAVGARICQIIKKKKKKEDFTNHNFQILERSDVYLPLYHEQTSHIQILCCKSDS